MIVLAVCLGIGQGMLPLVGYNFGAKKKERVGEIVAKAGLASFMWGALSWVVVTLFSTQIMSLFNMDPNFLSGGTSALQMFALGFFTIGPFSKESERRFHLWWWCLLVSSSF